MEAAYRKEADCMIVPMPREVDHHVAGNMSREIDLLAESWHVHRIVFDFAGTDFMDSSGIGILIGRKKTMDMHAGKVTAVNLGERVYKIFEKSGLFQIISLEEVHFDAKSVNEGLARMVVTAFMTNMNPTLEQIADVKTAVSEAVTNAIIHGYEDETKQVELTCDQNGQQLVVTVEDHGVGIEDLEQALQPFFTTKPELERSGMGFSFMEAFMDRIEVRSKKGEGTRVVMWKYIEREREQ